MTPSSKLAAAALAALTVLAPTAFADPPGAPGPGVARGTERTEDPAAGSRSRASGPGRVIRDREAGRDVPGRTFAPQSDRAPSGGANVTPDGRTPRAPAQSPATGDASGGDRRTEGPGMRRRAWASDPNVRVAFGESHSVGVADLRRVNAAGAGDLQPPARRVHGASPPPREDRFESDDRRSERGRATDAQGAASPSTRLPWYPGDAHGTESAAPPPASAQERSRREQ
jgi:hypothetical protein